MAKVHIEGDTIDIRVSLLERVMLAERPRKLPLARIRRVDPHPPLLDMMLHWSDQSGVWLCGVSAYDGHMIPSARHPSNTLAIELESDEFERDTPERIYIEVDDESPSELAARISRALSFARTPEGAPDQRAPHGALLPNATERSRAVSHNSQVRTEGLMPTTSQAASTSQQALMEALDVELEDDVQLRDPLMQGSLPPPPMRMSEPAPEMKLDDDKDLTRMGGWLVGLGSLGLLTGGVMLAGGALPGLLAVGAGVTCALLGGVALAVVAHHQG
ncbi:MAG: hypothetical protein RLZZ450_5097 [Pseudomonadota bacterium]|jgi:hypothetical protein